MVDLGAGDGRFANGGNFISYDGFEIDTCKDPLPHAPLNFNITYTCAFNYDGELFDSCIGNPPYVRHHDINPIWRNEVAARLRKELSIEINRLCNLYIYFMFLGLSYTTADGFVGMIVPYEWVSRPSSKVLRDYILSKGWNVDVYKFEDDIFKDVLTTASITIIDKSKNTARWRYFNIDSELNIRERKGATGSSQAVLEYEGRGSIWALRGLSPGTQKIFTLTEGERIHFGLKKNVDVARCVTTLRHVPNDIKLLNSETFSSLYIEKGVKCWLIRSDKPISNNLEQYLASISPEERNTSTCNNRPVWYQYKLHPTPKILYAAGFTSIRPKFLINEVGARAIGSVHGIHSHKVFDAYNLLRYFSEINMEERIVPHANSLKKIEVRQMNGILKGYLNNV